MGKIVIASTSVLVSGVSFGMGEIIDTDVETADFLIRHGRAVDPESEEGAAIATAAKAAAEKEAAEKAAAEKEAAEKAAAEKAASGKTK